MKTVILFFSLVFSYSLALADTDQTNVLPTPERAYELPTSDKLTQIQEQLTQSVGDLRKSGKLKATIQDLEAMVAKISTEVCEEKEIVMCQALIKADIFNNAYTLILDSAYISGNYLALLLKRTVLLKDTKKASSVLKYFKEVHIADYSDVLVATAKSDAPGSSFIQYQLARATFIPNEISVQVEAAIDLTGIPGLKPTAPERVGLNYKVHFEGLVEVQNQVRKLFFGSQEIIFIDDADYEDGGLKLEMKIAHELAHYRSVQKNRQQAFQSFQERLKLAQHVQTESLGKKEFRALSYHKHFIEYVSQIIAESQKVHKNLTAADARKIILQEVGQGYAAIFNNAYPEYQSIEEENAYYESLKYRKWAGFGVDLDTVLKHFYPETVVFFDPSADGAAPDFSKMIQVDAEGAGVYTVMPWFIKKFFDRLVRQLQKESASTLEKAQ